MILIDRFKLSLKKIYNGFKDIISSPAKVINLCWQKIFKVIEQEFFFISLMMIFNFMPYLYLFCLYNQYENAIGGLFKPFSVIIFMGLIINSLHGKLKKCLKYFILSISMILSLMELFIISKYYTFTTAGIISVIIGTNLHETIEFITMYFSWSYLIFIIALALCIYVLNYISKKVKLNNKLVILFLPYFCLYSLFYAIIPGKNLTECLTFTRLMAPVEQAVEDAIAFREIYTNMQNNVQILDKGRDIPNIVFILGESTSKGHMSLYGYPLETTPKMDKMAQNNELYVFKDVISSHAYTIGSLREVFTFHNYEATNKWYECNNLFDIMKKAGYKTYWLSNQETSGQWANVALAYANRCDYKKFTGIRQSYEKSYRADGELLPLLYEAMNNNSEKNFYVLHLMGCHGEYENRYTPDFAKFSDVDETKGIIKTQEAKTKRAQYDNAILYNDTIVTQVMEAFKDKDAIVIYMPDHGEEVYDLKNFNGHSDDNPTKSMLEIPFIIYTTEKFKQKYPIVDAQIKDSVDKKYMTDDLIHTILDITGIKTPEFQETRSIINPYYNQERKRIFLDKDYDNWQ